MILQPDCIITVGTKAVTKNGQIPKRAVRLTSGAAVSDGMEPPLSMSSIIFHRKLPDATV